MAFSYFLVETNALQACLSASAFTTADLTAGDLMTFSASRAQDSEARYSLSAQHNEENSV